MRLTYISQYRTQIMGFAILWVVLYHSKLDFSAPYFAPLNAIKLIGYGGVDIFFFLSGFGLVFGWLKKEYKILEFYRKRILRILPTYFLFMFLLAIVQSAILENFKVRGFIADLFGVGFLTARSYNSWFVPSIILCYLAFPIIISLFTREVIQGEQTENLAFMLLASSCLPLLLSIILVLTDKSQLLIFSVRMPSFMLGVLIGFTYIRNQARTLKDLKTNLITIILMFVVGLLLLFACHSLTTPDINWKYGFWWYPFIILTFPLCLTLASLIAWLDRKFSQHKPFICLNKILSFCGSYSLEIYLAHSLVLQLDGLLDKFLSSSDLLLILNTDKVLASIILVFASLTLAFLMKKVIGLLFFLRVKPSH